VNLVDEQNVPGLEGRQHAHQVTGPLEHGSRGDPDLDAHLPRHSGARAWSLPRAGGTEEERVIERLAGGRRGGVHRDLERLFDLGLTDEIVEAGGPEGGVRETARPGGLRGVVTPAGSRARGPRLPAHRPGVGSISCRRWQVDAGGRWSARSPSATQPAVGAATTGADPLGGRHRHPCVRSCSARPYQRLRAVGVGGALPDSLKAPAHRPVRLGR